MADSFFSIDMGEKYTHLADAKKVGDLLEVYSLGKVETKEGFFTAELEKTIEEQASSISKLISNIKITKKNVNVVIPDSLTYNQILTMPYLNEKELISAIKYQADQFIPMPIEETNIDLEIIQEYKEEKKILILIVAAAKKLIEKIQTTIELAGLVPESVETELSANSRFLLEFNKKIIGEGKQNILLINFGVNSTNLSYFDQIIPTLKESHNLTLGFQLFLKEVRVNTDTDEKKAFEILKGFSPDHPSSYPVETIIAPLLKEFVLELKRFISTKKPSTIYFIGNIANFTGLTSLIQKELSIPTAVLNPLSFIKKTSLVDNIAQDLPFFISTFGGNL
ncbi:pilus assembly protein PilM [Candidatus Roizmanbacteria bacterium]|nr:pilus assembly protein PilM [Candidatus Roizmanbacteria bacterium]